MEIETVKLIRWLVLITVVVVASACGGDGSFDTSSAPNFSDDNSRNEGRLSENRDKDRVLALQEKGGGFSVLPCKTYSFRTGDEEPCEHDREGWQRVGDADVVRWEDCTFGRHGLGGFVSQVTIVLDDESWYTIYVYDKNVC